MNNRALRSLLPLVLPSMLCVCLLACVSSPGGKSAGKDLRTMSGTAEDRASGSVSESAVSGGAGTALALPSKEQMRKNALDPTALGQLERGSPESIRIAVDRINADARGMTDQNRIALWVSGEIMKILYPLEKASWPVPAVPEQDPWIAAVRSARLGVYDYSAGSADFFSLVLPSLVLATTTMPGDYYADSEASLRKAAALNSRSVLPPLLLAVLAERTGDADRADGLYRQAWELDGSCYPAGVGHARAIIRRINSGLATTDGAEALEIGRALLERYPDAVEISELCAESAFALKDWLSADPYVLAVLKAEPGNAAYLLMRSRILVERREYLKATSLLDAFGTTNRTDRDYLLLRARVVREWNRNPQAAADILQEAGKRYPDDAEVLLALADAAYQTGSPINGITGREYVSRVLAKNPSSANALALLADDYLHTGEWASAVSTAERLVSLEPSDRSRGLLLRASIGAGQWSRAVSIGKTLYTAGTPSDGVTGLYLQALIAAGDSKTASSIITARLPDAPSALKSVLYYYQSRLSGDGDARLSALRSSLLADPRNAQALFAMYEWYLIRSDYRKAQYYLKQVIALDPANQTYTRLLSELDDLLAR